MKRLVLLALLASASASYAGTVTSLSDFTPDLSAVRNIRRDGPYASEWSLPAALGNLADHEGRSAGSFDDGGRGMLKFAVKAGADGKATIAFQDVGDTKYFKSFKVNGHKIDIPEPRKNGSILRVLVDLGSAGWHKVVAVTELKGTRPGRQDGFSVCRRH
ncbi:hypothetical protein [Amaricoccus solimangrovi]|uniref:Glycosyl hydrolase family 98 putative carbohydrate-binding module domain-containing protein n=1 Tax=Amaricoccus solimangrovi TaxID=2589815 RepID=A0A501X1A5_9RHOB|nr:hypothetical protein [Amaricoccus solimangrovi]TPE53506.1 hypothetical protein FJM51_00185 [Amaricoccus solimangrovi]